MIEEIAFIYWPAQFVEYTLDFALENVARQNKIKYTSIKYNPSERHLNTPASLAKTLICYCFDSNRNDSDYEQARLLRPNALFLQFGGDLHYDPGIDQHTRNVDIHVDTMFEVVGKVKELGRSSYHYYWSISQKMIDIINQDKKDYPKDIDFICLCRLCTSYRYQFFNEIGKQCTYITGHNEFDISKIISYYKRSRLCLGTSSPCIETWGRSMKGFRDWIAPFCDCVLIYDDIEEMRVLCEIVPSYTYNNYVELFDLKKTLYNNRDTYNFFLGKQKEWALDNTIDKQLSRILTDYFKEEFI